MRLEQMDVQIGKDLVGNSQRCFVALEPSATYRNFDEAKSMVDAVSNAGAQAIKFQTFLPGDVVGNPAGNLRHTFSYLFPAALK